MLLGLFVSIRGAFFYLINRGLYFIFVYQTVGISLKFGGIPLMLCGLFSREGYSLEQVNLKRVR